MADWQTEGRDLLAKGTQAWDRGDRLNAEAYFRQLTQEFPDRPEGYNKIGVVFAETGQLDEAERHFLLALTKDRGHAPALTNLGNIYLERGKTEDAIQHYLLALQNDPDYPAAHRNLGVAYRRQGRYYSYVSHFKRSQRLDGRKSRQELFRRSGSAFRSTAKSGGPTIPSFIWLIVAAIGVVIILSVFHL